MIYNNSTPITLYGADADNFLESYGIELYEDSIVIGESLFNGYDGECLLNENGIFLYEDHIVLEGEQAEEYKARKAKEKEDAKKAEDDRYIRRYNPGTNRNITGNRFSKHPDKRSILRNAYDDNGNDPEGKNYEKTIGADNRRHSASWNKSVDAIYAGKIKAFDGKAEHNVADSYNRHIRRHPKQYKEGTIFESVEFI